MLWNEKYLLKQRVILLGTAVCVFLFLPSVSSQVSQEKSDFSYGERLYSDNFFDLASIQFQNFIREYPNSPHAARAQFLVGECEFFSNKYDAAKEAYLRLLIKYPASPDVDQAQFRIGVCFEASGEMNEAVQSYLRVAEFHPVSEWASESLYRAAVILIDKEDFVRAESVVTQLLDRAGVTEYRSMAAFLFAELYMKQEEYEKAIRILRPLLERPIRESDMGETNFQLGKIHEHLGRWRDGEVFYQKVLSVSADIGMKQRASYRLGCLLEMRGENTQAVQAFEQAVTLGIDVGLNARALYRIGLIRARQKDYENAVQAFEKVENNTDSLELRMAVLYEKAKCLEALGRLVEAAGVYESILMEDRIPPILAKKALLSSARRYVDDEQFEKALAAYNSYLKLFSDDPLTDVVLLKKARICIDDLGRWDEGMSILRRIGSDFPESRRLPEVRYVLANGLEKLGRMREAMQIYKSVADQYSTIEWAEASEERIQRIQLLYPGDTREGLSRWGVLVRKFMANSDDPGLLFDLGLVSLDDLAQFEDAVEFFTRYLASAESIGNRDETLFHIARSYEALYLRDDDISQLERARHFYTSVISEYPESDWADDAALRLIHRQDDQSLDIEFQAYLDLLEKHPQSDKKEEILYRLGMAAVKNDSLQFGRTILNRLLGNYPDGEFFERSLYSVGKIHYDLRELHQADSVFQSYARQFDRGKLIPAAYFYRAKIALFKNDTASAVPLLETLQNRYYFSPWADSGRIVLGELYNHTGDYGRAVTLYLSALETDSLRQWASDVGLAENAPSHRKEFMLGLAKAYQGLGEHKKAKNTYLRYLRENPNPEDRIVVFTALSRIAEMEGMLSRSEDYLSLVAQEAPSEEVIEELGEFRFRLGRYDDAVATFDQAIGITPIEEKQARLSAKIIVSLLRMDKIPQAEVRMNVFEQTFKKIQDFKEYQAEFYLEKGKARIRRKEFDLAHEALREVTQKYDDTVYRPEAELETAKVFLITNKIEDALKILTEMPGRYPDHRILAQVYLNLGDHYFRSQQYENALRALRLSLEVPGSDVISVAMRYMIRVYDSLRMWDAAMSMTREYIRRFPDAEDALQKRVQIGNFYMNLDEYGRAIEVFRNVKKEADAETEAEVQYWIGKCYYSMGNFEQSIFEFMKVAYLSRPTKLPWDTTALYEAGQAYLRLEKPHQARKLFEQIVRREGSASDLGRIARQRIQEIDESLPDKDQGKS